MSNQYSCIAIDLGAESCRVTLGQWDGARAHIRPVHRFANGPVEREGHLYWELDRVWKGVEAGLRLSADLVSCEAGGATSNPQIDSIGVDGWAVDYVRLDRSGRVLGDPFCYRDRRTENAMPEVWERIARSDLGVADGKAWLYERTGIQFLRFNTLYQLYTDRRDGVDPGAHWMNLPEYMLFRLTGSAPEALVSEYTNATHTQLVDVHSGKWCDHIFDAVGLNRSAAPSIVGPGTRLGPLRGPLASVAAYQNTQLIAPACHDTGSAVAGIQDSGTDWAFIISGTWSLVGTLLDTPCTTEAARRANFTNEGGIGGKIRFLKNVNGMWLLQECLREWNFPQATWSLEQLLAACRGRSSPAVTFDVDSADLLLPGNMAARINRELERAGHAPVPTDPEHAPIMADIILTSLAARYTKVLEALGEVTGRAFRRMYVVGGGSQNEYLNRLIEERTGLNLLRGPVESSTVGNLAVQFAALEGGHDAVTPAAVAAWAERLGFAATTAGV